MNTAASAVEMPTGAGQAIEVADRLGVTFGASLSRTAIYRCVCTCQRVLISSGTPPTSAMVELLARTAIEQRLGRTPRATQSDVEALPLTAMA